MRLRPAASASLRPVAVEPVKLIRRTAGFSTSSSPIGPASPGACVTMFRTPAGRPASLKISPQIRPPTIGDSSDGFSTTVFPSASGAAIERADRISAAFQGAIARDDADRLANAHGERPRVVGGEDLAERRVRGGRRLAQQARHEAHLEHAEAEAGAGLPRQLADDLVAARLEDVGGLEEDRLTLGRHALRPLRERIGGGLRPRAPHPHASRRARARRRRR